MRAPPPGVHQLQWPTNLGHPEISERNQVDSSLFEGRIANDSAKIGRILLYKKCSELPREAWVIKIQIHH